MLAPRILHFASHQIFWQCSSLIACESTPAGLPYGIHSTEAKLELKWRRALHQEPGLESLGLADANNIWRNMVARYTSCNLTKSEDKFVALIGVTTAMARALGERPLAGLWDGVDKTHRQAVDLPNQLAWSVKDGKAPVVGSLFGKPSQRYTEYRAPTWSWACLSGIVMLRPRINEPDKVYQADVPHAFVNFENPNIPAGPLQRDSTCLEVSGRMFKNMEFKQEGGVWNLWQSNIGTAHLDDDRDVQHLLFRDRGPERYKMLVADILLLCTYISRRLPVEGDNQMAYSGYALVVKKTEGLAIEYSRLGVFEFEGLSESTWERMYRGAGPVTVVLV
jgi:hypothetical protein